MSSEMTCRLCGADVFTCGGWLQRVNAKGCTPILECRPKCDAQLTDDQKLLGAIDGEDPTLCQCGHKPIGSCDEPWGPDCDLGNNENYVRVLAS